MFSLGLGGCRISRPVPPVCGRAHTSPLASAPRSHRKSLCHSAGAFPSSGFTRRQFGADPPAAEVRGSWDAAVTGSRVGPVPPGECKKRKWGCPTHTSGALAPDTPPPNTPTQTPPKIFALHTPGALTPLQAPHTHTHAPGALPSSQEFPFALGFRVFFLSKTPRSSQMSHLAPPWAPAFTWL